MGYLCRMHARVVCLGNELVGDDGIGIRVGRVLAALRLPAGVVVDYRPGLSLELLEMIRGEERLILVDAMRTGRTPGTCVLLDLSEVDSLATLPYCSHGFGIAEVISVCRFLMPERVPPRVLVVGIEGEQLQEFSLALSPKVRNALPEAVSTVLRLVGAPAELVEAGLREAESRKDWDPDPFDVPGLAVEQE